MIYRGCGRLASLFSNTASVILPGSWGGHGNFRVSGFQSWGVYSSPNLIDTGAQCQMFHWFCVRCSQPFLAAFLHWSGNLWGIPSPHLSPPAQGWPAVKHLHILLLPSVTPFLDSCHWLLLGLLATLMLRIPHNSASQSHGKLQQIKVGFLEAEYTGKRIHPRHLYPLIKGHLKEKDLTKWGERLVRGIIKDIFSRAHKEHP